MIIDKFTKNYLFAITSFKNMIFKPIRVRFEPEIIGPPLIVCALSLFLLSFYSAQQISTALWLIFPFTVFWFIKKKKCFSLSCNSFLFIVSLFVFSLLFFLLPNIIHLTMLPIDGTYNHDKLWYIRNAKYLLNHSLSSPYISDPGLLLEYAVPREIDGIGRYGTGAIVSLIASFFLSDPVYVLLTIEVLSIVSILLCVIYISSFFFDFKLAYCLSFFSGSLLLIVQNGNTATLLGLAFLLLTLCLFTELINKGGWGYALLLSSSLSIMCYVYIEFLAIFCVFLVLFSICFYKRLIVRLPELALAFFVFIFLASPVLSRVFGALSTRINAVESKSGGMNSEYFDFLSVYAFYSHIATLIVPLQNHVSDLYTKIIFLIFSIMLPVSIYCLFKLEWRVAIALVVSFISPYFYSLVSGYGYGLMKGVQYLTPLVMLLNASIMHFIFTWKFNSYAIKWAVFVLFSVSMFVTILLFYVFLTRSIIIGSHKRVTNDLVALEKVNDLLPKDELLLISNKITNFHTSRWIGYFLDKTRLQLPDKLQHGGYYYPQPDLDDSDKFNYSLIKSNDYDLYGGDLIFQNDSFSVVYPGMLVEGFYDKEEWGRWMSEKSSFYIKSAPCERELQFTVSRYIGPQTRLFISSQDVLINNIPAKVSITLSANENHEIELVSEAGSYTPNELKINNDQRELSFGFDYIWLSECKTNE